MGTSAKGIDDSEVFVDTSVLVDFVQLGSKADCFDIFKIRTDCQKTTTPKVEAEFTKKRQNRQYIVRKFLEKVGQGSSNFSDFELPHKDNFSAADEAYARELLVQLADSNTDEARKELAKRRKLFKKGNRSCLVRKLEQSISRLLWIVACASIRLQYS